LKKKEKVSLRSQHLPQQPASAQKMTVAGELNPNMVVAFPLLV
jgi:hypothetical protein